MKYILVIRNIHGKLEERPLTASSDSVAISVADGIVSATGAPWAILTRDDGGRDIIIIHSWTTEETSCE